MLPETTARVPAHTSEEINAEIRRRTETNVARCAADGPEAIERRLYELEREWDIERMLEANASTLALIGLGMGAFVDRRFFALPALVMGFLLQHALQGWCPPVPVLRHLGFRTQAEIDEERYALKILRGDFKPVEETSTASARDLRRLMYAVRR
jgi:hypothetical protein